MGWEGGQHESRSGGEASGEVEGSQEKQGREGGVPVAGTRRLGRGD